MRKLISTGSPFEKTAGYSRAVVEGEWCFVSGTTGYNYATMTMPDSVEEQTRNCLSTIRAALEEGGFAMADVVRAHYYITDAAYRGPRFSDPRRGFRRDPAGGDDDRLRPEQARNEDRDRGDGAEAALLTGPVAFPPCAARVRRLARRPAYGT